jgi:hypothetical protein
VPKLRTVGADEQLGGDFGVGLALADEMRDLALPAGHLPR